MVSYHKVKFNLKTNFVFGLVSLDCRLRLLEYLPVQCLDKMFLDLIFHPVM